MLFVRSKLFDAFLTVWTLLIFAGALPVLMMLRRQNTYVRKVTYAWLRGVLVGLKYIVGLDYVERGRENIPCEPCLIIANHQSSWETFALPALFAGASLVAKQETARIPLVGWYLTHYPLIMIDRGGGAGTLRKMIKGARAALAEGRSVIMFPEGTRKKTSERVEFRRGIEFLYSELGRPVLPVALNSGNFWQGVRKSKGTISVSYLPPIMPGLSRAEFRKRAEALLQEEKEALSTKFQHKVGKNNRDRPRRSRYSI